MLRNPSWWEEPPEDRTNECRKCGELYADMTGFCAKCQKSEDTDFDPPIDDEPVVDRDCDYWNRVT